MITEIFLNIIFALPKYLTVATRGLSSTFIPADGFHDLISTMGDVLRLFDFMFPDGRGFSVIFLSFLYNLLTSIAYLLIAKILLLIASAIRGANLRS